MQLLTTDRSVLEIALQVGFGSHEGFTRAFRAHFGLTPRRFRERGVDADEETLARHADLALHIGPCLGLYRVELQPKPKPLLGDIMSYDITQKTLDRQPVLYRSMKCEPAAIAGALGECLPAVASHAAQNGIAMVGPPFTRYVSFGPGLVSLEAGIPVAAGAQGNDEIQAGELPGGTVARTIHTGPYDGLGDAHAEVEKWIAAQGLEVGGAPWEVYLTDPGEVPDPAEWKTEVVWPLK